MKNIALQKDVDFNQNKRSRLTEGKWTKFFSFWIVLASSAFSYVFFGLRVAVSWHNSHWNIWKRPLYIISSSWKSPYLTTLENHQRWPQYGLDIGPSHLTNNLSLQKKFQAKYFAIWDANSARIFFSGTPAVKYKDRAQHRICFLVKKARQM